MIPGEIWTEEASISLNQGRQVRQVLVRCCADRPIQVGSHFHFYEVNPALEFARDKALGMRLDIASGTAVRFEPGQERLVDLVTYAGERKIYGFRGQVMNSLESYGGKDGSN